MLFFVCFLSHLMSFIRGNLIRRFRFYKYSSYIWKSSQKAQSPVRSPLMFGWENKGGLVPVFFLGQMSSHFLQDLVCICKGKSICSSSCVCFEQILSCTDLCPCYGSDQARSSLYANTQLRAHRRAEKKK
jgi:hypothetical protein